MLQKRERVRNPKVTNRRTWYRYYAGFSEEFVEDALLGLTLEPGSLVFDPWAGSGTATTVAARAGHRALGFDINPVLVVVAKARSASTADWVKVKKLAASLGPKGQDGSGTSGVRDPLRTWFGPGSVAAIRHIEAVGAAQFEGDHRIDSVVALKRLTPECALWYLALFLMVRRFVEPILGTNPTWTRALHPTKVLRPRNATVLARFAAAVDDLGLYIKGAGNDHAWSRTSVSVCTSSLLDLEPRSVNAIVTSPPYCTRIDYAVYCAPEIAVLGPRVGTDVLNLRAQMIGSPLVGRQQRDVENWGPTAAIFLERVFAHASKASRGYYYKYFLRYLAEMQKSVAEISRVSAPGCQLVLVAQGSFYKEIYLDLPSVLVDMFVANGWILTSSEDFEVGASFLSINSRARFYKKTRRAVESVLMLRANWS